MPTIRYSDGSSRDGEMRTPADLPPLGLDGADLTFIRIDHQTRLQFGAAEIVIETPFRLATKHGERTLDPSDRTELGALLAVYPTTLVSAVVEANLTLRLTFEDAATVDVPQDPRYEAWQIVGPGSRLIVCPPKGDGALAVWP